ncbi:hypothetical protein FGW37_31030 [Streptomyces rectiverticillatus]|uniref:hypothetical protein n=1 Tax=Streptomyces rectiverticillatus TaxID=173860 RepID=UPI0015C319A5|nr:hypothetical protein [Streptomyces rectiverticillatus]QLE75430.1 hypothetical protein FGW37_31030 [Streptomyces rectiverticillatus]
MTQTPPVPQHQLHLRDDLTPVMTAGTYTLHVTHTVEDASGAKNALPEATRQVVVDAPRFTLDPACVLGVYPPPDTMGDYRGALPHITVNQSSLPWARLLGGSTKEDAPRLPWLALLLVTDHDLRKDDVRGEYAPVRQVSEVAGKSDQQGPVLLPLLDDVPPAVAATSCRTLDVRREALLELLPRRRELPFLAHARDVDIVPVPRGADVQAAERGLRRGRFAVVLGNRFPRSQGVPYTAHLVSLDGHGTYDFLGGPVDSKRFAAVRFVSLWSWSFVCTENPADFHALAERLAENAQKEPVLRLPTPPVTGGDPVRERVRQRRTHGYVALRHRLPSGEQSICWYRGPFTAHPAQDPRAGSPSFGSAAASLIHLKDDAVFDVSYAAAFEAGRLLALANYDLAKGLGRSRSRAMTALQDLVAVQGAGGQTNGGPAVARFNDLVKNHDIGTRITQGLKKKPVTGEGGDHAPASPGSEEGWQAALSAFLSEDAEATAHELFTATLSETARACADELAAAGLDRTKLLDSLPFPFLVPDMRMLPPESLRLFHVDRYWLDALYAGAAALGTATTLDREFTARLLETTGDGEAPPPVLGLLVRSALIRDWPDLTYEATPAMKVLARRPAPDTLLLLFTGVPAKVTLCEPPQALNFGLDSRADNGTLGLRRITAAPGKRIGSPAGRLTGVYALTRAPAGKNGKAFPRAAEVLNIDDRTGVRTLVQALEKTLRDTGAPQQGIKLTPATLAAQLFNSAHRLTVQPVLGDRHG